MLSSTSQKSIGVYKVACGDGSRCVVYNASEIGNPADHTPDKWYWRSYTIPLDQEQEGPFETANQAEWAARERHRWSGASALH